MQKTDSRTNTGIVRNDDPVDGQFFRNACGMQCTAAAGDQQIEPGNVLAKFETMHPGRIGHDLIGHFNNT